MVNYTLDQLIEGYRLFRKDYAGSSFDDYRKKFATTQQPQVMVISCCDSRVEPAIITYSGLGSIFTVKNVANLVPPCSNDENAHQSISAALEYAVLHLKVKDIIVMGHSSCGGIRALIEHENSDKSASDSFIIPWMNIAAPAKKITKEKFKNASIEEQASICERQSLICSLQNLKTFPWICAAINNGELGIHAWHFDIVSGIIETYDQQMDIFNPL